MKLHEILKIVTQEVPGVDLTDFQFETVKSLYLDRFRIQYGVVNDAHAFKVQLIEDSSTVGLMMCHEITDLNHGKLVLMVKRTWCSRNFRRRGIISNLYRFVYHQIGCSLMSDVEQSPETVKLWDKLRSSWDVKMIDMETGLIGPINSTEIYCDRKKALFIEGVYQTKASMLEDYRFGMEEN